MAKKETGAIEGLGAELQTGILTLPEGPRAEPAEMHSRVGPKLKGKAKPDRMKLAREALAKRGL